MEIKIVNIKLLAVEPVNIMMMVMIIIIINT